MSSAALQAPQAIHESLWRATQLAGRTGTVLSCGDAALARELPSGGWPADFQWPLFRPRV
jgi:protein ImuA